MKLYYAVCYPTLHIIILPSFSLAYPGGEAATLYSFRTLNKFSSLKTKREQVEARLFINVRYSVCAPPLYEKCRLHTIGHSKSSYEVTDYWRKMKLLEKIYSTFQCLKLKAEKILAKVAIRTK